MGPLALLEVRLRGLPAVRDRGRPSLLVVGRSPLVAIRSPDRLLERPLRCLAFTLPENPLPAAKVPPPLRA